METHVSKQNYSYIIFSHVLFLMCYLPLKAQDSINLNIDSILNRIEKQISIFPQEKIHVHTDKSYYISGEKIWLRAYLMNTYTNKQDTSSLYVYGELINPLDSIVSRIKIIGRNGAYSGHIKLNEDLPAGTYNIRFYTKYLENLGEDYFFSKSIKIGTPLSTKFKAEVISTHHTKNRINVNIGFKNIKTDERVEPNNIYAAYNKSLLPKPKDIYIKYLKLNKEQSVIYKIDTTKEYNNSIYIEYEIDGSLYKEFISIPLADDDFHVGFFPEGGHLLSKIENTIAFKAIASDGFSTEIEGLVCSEDGDTITYFSSKHKGMGQFAFIGDPQKKYFAKCTNNRGVEKQFELPPIQENGYNIAVRQIKDHIYVSILSPNTIPDGLKLLMHCRGHVIYLNDWKINNNNIIFPKDQFPTGLIQCILLDSSGIPLSERLFFNLDEKTLPRIQQTNNKKKYSRRDLVISRFDIQNHKGEPLNGSFSVSVTDDRDIKIDSTQNMLTSLLLTSELKGNIEEPSYYFRGDRYANYALDLLMLTQGWRRYNMPEVVQGNFQYSKLNLEFLHTITGRVKGGLFYNRKSKSTPVFMLNLKTGKNEMTTTDNEGYFRFETILPDSLKFMIIASSPEGKTRYEVELDPEVFPDVCNNPIQAAKIDNSFFYDYIKKADDKYTLENGMRMVHLKDIEVTAKRIEEEKRTSIYSSPFNTKIDIESPINKYSRLSNVLEKQTGVQLVYGRDGMRRVFFRRQKAPAVIMVDDMESDYILDLDPPIDEFESMEIRKTGSPIFGVRGSGGAIILTTKRGLGNLNSSPPLNAVPFSPLGYQPYVEFYSPKYETKEDKMSEKPDLRSTIYWNPNIKIVNGKAEVEFYTADEASIYSIFIDGISDNGEPLHIINKIGE